MQSVSEIKYNGEYPNLCRGRLFVTVDGKKWKFPDYCLSSGGRVWFDKEWMEHVESGKWRINKWPKKFPPNLRKEVIEAINNKIPHGCCGGCV